MTGPIRDIGQNVLQSSFQTASNSGSSHNYHHIFFLIAFLEEAFVNNIIILRSNYIITICINYDNNAIISSNCGRLQDLILLFKISMSTRKNFFGLYRKFGLASSKTFYSPGLDLHFCPVSGPDLRLTQLQTQLVLRALSISEKSGQGAKLSAQFHLVSRLRM